MMVRQCAPKQCMGMPSIIKKALQGSAIPLHGSTAVYICSAIAQTQAGLPLVLTFLPPAIEAWRGLQRYVTLGYIYRLQN